MKTIEEILDELVEEPDNYGNGFEWLCTKEEAINCMEAYASEQTEKYKELIDWLDNECPAVCPPLEPYTTADLSHDFAEILRSKLDDLKTELGL